MSLFLVVFSSKTRRNRQARNIALGVDPRAHMARIPVRATEQLLLKKLGNKVERVRAAMKKLDGDLYVTLILIRRCYSLSVWI